MPFALQISNEGSEPRARTSGKVSALKAVSEFYISQRMIELTLQHAKVFQILSVALNYGYTGYGTLKV